MSRADDYAAFVRNRPALQAVVVKVQEQRRIIDKTLTWARLKNAYRDYHPWLVLKGVFDGNQFGNVVLDPQTKIRFGWKRWEEIRDRINAIDNWLKNPASSNMFDVLKEAMVSIPDSIDFELAAMDRALKQTAQILQNTVKDAGSAVFAIAAPIVALYVAGTVYNVTKKK